MESFQQIHTSRCLRQAIDLLAR